MQIYGLIYILKMIAEMDTRFFKPWLLLMLQGLAETAKTLAYDCSAIASGCSPEASTATTAGS